MKLIIPEYKIELLNKSKKIINTVENINLIPEIKNLLKKTNKEKKVKKEVKKEIKKDKKEVKKLKTKKQLRTLWVRRKKKN